MRELLENVGWHVRRQVAATLGRDNYLFGKNMCGACALCSFAIVKVLENLGHSSELIVGVYGGFDHCWVECAGFFVDATATQFSHLVFDYQKLDFPEVYVTRALDVGGVPEDILYLVGLRGDSALDHVRAWEDHGPEAHKTKLERAIANVTKRSPQFLGAPHGV